MLASAQETIPAARRIQDFPVTGLPVPHFASWESTRATSSTPSPSLLQSTRYFGLPPQHDRPTKLGDTIRNTPLQSQHRLKGGTIYRQVRPTTFD